MHSLGQRLRFIRAMRDLTKMDLARLAGIHRNNYRLIELDQVHPTVPTLQAIAQALGVSCGQLLGEQPLTELLEEVHRA